MSYTKKLWDVSEAITLEALQHLDTQYAAAIVDLSAHVIAGHPTVYHPKSDCDTIFWHAGNDGAASGLDADTLGGAHASEVVGGVASGIMCWWYPENGAIPAGFNFANGDNGTYDMRSRFPIGASGTLAAGSTVGNSQITPVCSCVIGGHTLTVPEIFHTHTLQDYFDASMVIWTSSEPNHSIATTAYNSARTTSSAGGAGSHDHPGVFTGDAKSLDPLFTYLVIIQKS